MSLWVMEGLCPVLEKVRCKKKQWRHVARNNRSMVDGLVEGSSAVFGSTQAGDLLVLDGEFIIVRDLFVDADRLARIDDYFLFGFYSDDFGVAVWLKVNRRK